MAKTIIALTTALLLIAWIIYMTQFMIFLTTVLCIGGGGFALWTLADTRQKHREEKK